MKGPPFALKEDPEHDDLAPPSGTDSEYRHIQVYDAAGRTDDADQATAPAAPSSAESAALAALSCQTLHNPDESAE